MSYVRNPASGIGFQSRNRLFVTGRRVAKPTNRRIAAHKAKRFASKFCRLTQRSESFKKVFLIPGLPAYHGMIRKPYRIERKGGAA